MHLPLPPVPIELQPKQRHPQRAQLCARARGWLEAGAREERGRGGPGRSGEGKHRPREKGHKTAGEREEKKQGEPLITKQH